MLAHGPMGSTDLSYQHGREPLRNALTAAAFWTLAVLALINLRDLHLWESPQVEVLVARATMASCALLLGLVGIWCVVAWRRSGSLAPVRRTLGGTPGILLFAGVASYLAIGTAMLDVEAQGPDRGRAPEILRSPFRRARGGRGRQPCDAGANGARAPVAGPARSADFWLRDHSRFAGAARSRHPAALSAPVSP